MQAPFTHETFAKLGFEFSPEEEARLIEDMTHALYDNVGREISRLVSRQQRKEFARLDKLGDMYGINEWFKANAPWSDDVVQDCYDLMMGDFVEGERNWRKWDVGKSAKRRAKHRPVVA